MAKLIEYIENSSYLRLKSQHMKKNYSNFPCIGLTSCGEQASKPCFPYKHVHTRDYLFLLKVIAMYFLSTSDAAETARLMRPYNEEDIQIDNTTGIRSIVFL